LESQNVREPTIEHGREFGGGAALSAPRLAASQNTERKRWRFVRVAMPGNDKRCPASKSAAASVWQTRNRHEGAKGKQRGSGDGLYPAAQVK